MLGIGVTPRLYVRRKANVAKTMSLISTGNGSGVATLRMQVGQTLTVTLEGSARFYTNAEGTTGESTSWTITAGSMSIIYLRAPTGVSRLTIPNRYLLQKIGELGVDGWVATANAPKLVITPAEFFYLTSFRAQNSSVVYGNFSENTEYIYLGGGSEWSNYTKVPNNLQVLTLNNVSLIVPPLPDGVKIINFFGNDIVYNNTSQLPQDITSVSLVGDKINWIFGQFGGSSNVVYFAIFNHRISKMADSDIITLFNSIRTREGSMPSTIYIGDYTNWMSPPQAVHDARSEMMAAKNITTVILSG